MSFVIGLVRSLVRPNSGWRSTAFAAIPAPVAGLQFMLIAGEASGDLLAAELVHALRTAPEVAAREWPPRFFGAGGPRMKEAGVDLVLDLTEHAVVGLGEALRGYFKFRRFFAQLLRLAAQREPDAVVLVDFAGFNRRFAAALRRLVRRQTEPFHNWRPRIVYYVSPQVWASRPRRAWSLSRDVDLLLSVIPFEPAWYAARVPDLRVAFVGHPILDRHTGWIPGAAPCEPSMPPLISPVPPATDGRADPSASAVRSNNLAQPARSAAPLVLLLPGSRRGELERHLPVMLAAARHIAAQLSARFRLVLPNPTLAARAQEEVVRLGPPGAEVRAEGLAASLAEAQVAIASTGTVTLECAVFGVPTVALYKTSWLTYHLARRIVQVKYLAMPNLLARAELFPEFIQHAATPENLAREALDLLRNAERRARVRAGLREVVKSLGPPGASARAAAAILRLVGPTGFAGK